MNRHIAANSPLLLTLFLEAGEALWLEHLLFA
jgi:hypothetical protein